MKGQDNRSTAEPVFQVIENSGMPGDSVVRQSFFSNKSAENYMATRQRHLANPEIYIASGYDNAEWKVLRKILLSLVGE